ncbi:MAG: GNAT family N-acetyltransferase [Spirochaetales bacterium]|nr:GNAT family N-acetyltransferase [Spirochaetales bacterium]
MIDDLLIREMHIQDVDSVSELMKQLDELFHSGHDISAEVISDTFEKMHEHKSIYKNYVALLDERIVGFISVIIYKTFFHPGGTALINELIVDKNFRGKGIGRQLINKIKVMANIQRFNEIEVSTSLKNKKAIKFYKKTGFADESILLGMELFK